MKYFVLSHLQHDKKEYHRGDEVSLSEEQAAALLEAGVIQTEEVTEPAPMDPLAVIEKQAREEALPEAPAREESGEPALDGPKEKKGKKAGKDISADL